MNIDRASLEELVQNADIEGLLEQGSPSDEYDPEVDALLSALHGIPPGTATSSQVVTLFEGVWRRSFSLSEQDLASRKEAFKQIAERILHFFPESA